MTSQALPTAGLLQALGDMAVRTAGARTPVPTLRPGTARSGQANLALVVLDGDTDAIPVVPLTPSPAAGDRVMVLLTPPSGAYQVGYLGDSRDRWGSGGGGGTDPTDLGYTHVQATAATTWVIDHGLGFTPNVAVVDSAGEQVEGEVDYTGTTQVTLRFSAAFAGTAYLS